MRPGPRPQPPASALLQVNAGTLAPPIAIPATADPRALERIAKGYGIEHGDRDPRRETYLALCAWNAVKAHALVTIGDRPAQSGTRWISKPMPPAFRAVDDRLHADYWAVRHSPGWDTVPAPPAPF